MKFSFMGTVIASEMGKKSPQNWLLNEKSGSANWFPEKNNSLIDISHTVPEFYPKWYDSQTWLTIK